jgi:hypothetical protein
MPGGSRPCWRTWRAREPKPQKNALIACLEQGFAALLQNTPPAERGPAKARLAERLNRDEGLDPALCADTLDLLEAALFGAGMSAQAKVFCRKCGKELQTEWKTCPYCGTAVASDGAPQATPNQPPTPASPAHQGKEVWREL